MQINTNIFRAYDIRGIYPEEINEEAIKQIVQGIYTYFCRSLNKKNLSVVLGQDMRLSSPKLAKSARKALLDCGAKVIDIGLSSTPTFYFSVFHYGYDAGIQISASHNPKEYNGIKFVKNTPSGLLKIGEGTGMEEVKEIVLAQDFIAPAKGKLVKRKGVLKDELKNIFKIVSPKNVKRFKIAVDPANAMGVLFLKELFKKVSAELTKINFKLDGNFPSHQPDPLKPENLVDLQKIVLQKGADLGISPDGDGDRVFFIDEKGQVIPASYITALLAQELLKQNPGEKVGFDVRYTKIIENAVVKAGGKTVVTRVGHALITSAMQKENMLFAGESSGHYYFKQTGFAESSLLAIMLVLNIMSREQRPISEILKPLITFFQSGETNFKINSQEKIGQIMEKVKEKYKDGKLSTIDGISIDFADWRFSLRRSNTEPLLRLNLEAKTKELLAQKQEELNVLINN